MKREGEQQKDDVLFKVRICTEGTGEWCIILTLDGISLPGHSCSGLFISYNYPTNIMIL